MDRLFEESFVRPRGVLAPFGVGEPALDVYETDNDVVVNAAIAGIKRRTLTSPSRATP
jgi:HSP20 family molecular chaperone IbpA